MSFSGGVPRLNPDIGANFRSLPTFNPQSDNAWASVAESLQQDFAKMSNKANAALAEQVQFEAQTAGTEYGYKEGFDYTTLPQDQSIAGKAYRDAALKSYLNNLEIERTKFFQQVETDWKTTPEDNRDITVPQKRIQEWMGTHYKNLPDSIRLPYQAMAEVKANVFLGKATEEFLKHTKTKENESNQALYEYYFDELKRQPFPKTEDDKKLRLLTITQIDNAIDKLDKPDAEKYTLKKKVRDWNAVNNAMGYYDSLGTEPVPQYGELPDRTPEGRKVVKNADGSFSTRKSKTFEVDGVHYVVPMLDKDGKDLTESAAIQAVLKAGGKDPVTGENMAFKTAEEAEQASIKLHEKDEKLRPVIGSREPTLQEQYTAKEHAFQTLLGVAPEKLGLTLEQKEDVLKRMQGNLSMLKSQIQDEDKATWQERFQAETTLRQYKKQAKEGKLDSEGLMNFAQENEKLVTPAETESIINDQIEFVEKWEKENEAREPYRLAYANNNKMLVNFQDKDAVDRGHKVFEEEIWPQMEAEYEKLKAEDPESARIYFSDTVSQYVNNTGIIPNVVVGRLRAMARSGDEQTKIEAAHLTKRLYQSAFADGTLVADQMETGDFILLDKINTYMDQGFGPLESINRSMDDLNPEKVKLLKAQATVNKESTLKEADIKFEDLFKEDGAFAWMHSFTHNGMSIPETQAHQIKSNIQSMYRTHFEDATLEGADKNQAHKIATSVVKNYFGAVHWGKDYRVMRYPLDKFYHIDGVDDAWMFKEMLDEIGGMTLPAPQKWEDIYLFADELTEAEVKSKGLPAYQVFVKSPSGRLDPVYERDENGNTTGRIKRWYPDLHKEMEAETGRRNKKRMDEFERVNKYRHDLINNPANNPVKMLQLNTGAPDAL